MPAAEDGAAAGAVGIEGQRVQPGRAEMRQHGCGNRKPFRRAGRRARGNRKVRTPARAEDIALAAQHAVHIRREFFIRAQLHALAEIPVIQIGRETRTAPEVSQGQLPNQTAIDCILRGHSVDLSLQMPDAPGGEPAAEQAGAGADERPAGRGGRLADDRWGASRHGYHRG